MAFDGSGHPSGADAFEPLRASAGPAPRGRPAATTRETIEEAAYELFLEQGFAATSVGDIASRAGVSRSSFFNYFAGKRDVLWGPVVRALERLPDALADAERTGADGDAVDPREPSTARAARLVCAAVRELARDATPHAIPVPVAQAEFMGVEREVLETGSVILVEQAGVLRAALGRLDPVGDRVQHGAIAWAIAGAVVAVAQAWASAGPGRGELEPRISEALAPIVRGCTPRPSA